MMCQGWSPEQDSSNVVGRDLLDLQEIGDTFVILDLYTESI